MARSFIALPKLLRNVSSLPKFHLITQRFCANHVVPEVKSQIKTTVKTPREIFELLSTSDDPSSLVATIEANKNEIDGRHIVLALTSMQKFYAANTVPPRVVHNSVPFLKITKILNRNLRTFDLPQVIQALKVLNLLKISSTSVIFQSLLKIITESVNNLSLEDIFFLTYLLKFIDPSPLHDALNTALPLVFLTQLDQQLDKQNIEELRRALWYASMNVKSKKVIDYIIESINNYDQPLDLDTAASIFYSLARVKYLTNNYLSILNRVQKVLETNASLLDEKDVIKLVKTICHKTKSGFDEYYNPMLLDRLVDYSIAKHYGFDEGMIILNGLNKLKHIHISLLRYLSHKCHQNPHVLEYHPLCSTTLLAGLSLANYKPPSWHQIQNSILRYYKYSTDDHMSLCSIALHFASLDCFDSSLIEKIFSTELILVELSVEHQRAFQKLYQAVKILYPSYSGSWPSEKFIQSFKTITKFEDQQDYPLLPALETILGGPSYVKTNVKTDLGHYIDHLVILQNDCPIAIECTKQTEDPKSILCMDDLIIPPDSKRIAILPLSSEKYSRNIKRLQGPEVLNIKTLEAMSFTVIHLSLDIWMSMPDHEKLPSLMRLIGLKNKKEKLHECENTNEFRI